MPIQFPDALTLPHGIPMRLLQIILLMLLFASGCATQQPLQTNKNYIAILPGKKVYVEAIVQNNSVRFQQVEVITHPEFTLTFEFTTTNAGVVLTAKNPLAQSFKYHIDRVDYKGNAQPTSSCPLLRDLGSMETWAHAIPELRIHSPRIIDANELNNCVY